ncbi:MAG: hypothetical protein QNI84_14075 [Henriciella sp.]|nr:hypothetical protein [Henriciella sp.]
MSETAGFTHQEMYVCSIYSCLGASTHSEYSEARWQGRSARHREIVERLIEKGVLSKHEPGVPDRLHAIRGSALGLDLSIAYDALPPDRKRRAMRALMNDEDRI